MLGAGDAFLVRGMMKIRMMMIIPIFMIWNNCKRDDGHNCDRNDDDGDDNDNGGGDPLPT